MKRDMNLIRELLFQLEDIPTDTIHYLKAPEGYSPDEVRYHATLLLESGLIRGRPVKTFSGSTFRDLSLTWDGHEFLDAIRPAAVWSKVEERLKSLGGAAFEVVKSLAVEEGKRLLGI